MLANALPTIAWICLALGLCSHVVWIVVDGRRPEMPREVHDCIAGIVGQLVAGLLILALASSAPEHIRNLVLLAGFFAVAIPFYPQLPASNDQPYHPMTARWQLATRRFFLRSRLCVAAGVSFGFLTAPEDAVIWGLGAVAATNLSFYRATGANRKPNWRNALPFLFSALMLGIAYYFADNLRAGMTWSFSDLQIDVSATIPGDDTAAMAMLTVYLAAILLLFLAAMVLDIGADLLRFRNAARMLLRFGLTIIRIGLMIALLFVLEPDHLPSVSAWIVWWTLVLTEFLVVCVPSPEPELDPETVPSGTAAVSA